jgi:hypothetical protein
VEVISSFLFLLGKLGIVGLCGIASYIWLTRAKAFKAGGSNEVSSIMIPIILVLVLAFVVTSMFLGIYKLTIDTILLCFCEDRNVNKGTAVGEEAFR